MLLRDFGASGVGHKDGFIHSFTRLRNEVGIAAGFSSLPWSGGQPFDCDIHQQMMYKIEVGELLG